MKTALDTLKAGIRKFGAEVYPQAAQMYQRADSEPQRPHTLMITCADSRVDPALITQSDPGELFVARNIGNVVPVYGEMPGGVSAVIEYAVLALGVQHIVVCGHSDCGAMKALLHPEAVAALPAVASWLQTTGKDLRVDGGPVNLTEKNVLLQLRNLRTHPSVAEALARKMLTVSGWIYEIGSGRVRISENGEEGFSEVGEGE